MQAKSLKTDALVQNYVHIVNDAIGQHRSEVPYKQMLSAVEAVASDIEAGIAVYKDDPSAPHDYFVLGWTDGTLEVREHGKNGDRTWWSMPREHLEQVVENPAPFLKNPMKLDLDWMSKRLGFEGLMPEQSATN